MGRSVIFRFGLGAALGAASIAQSHTPAAAAVSATIVPGTLRQGVVQTSLAGAAYADETSALGDFPLNTGASGSSVFPVTVSNANYNGNSFGGGGRTMIAFGNDGGVTLAFPQPVNALPGQKEFGLFTAQMLVGTGGTLFHGNMEAAVLVSANGSDWRTLTGTAVADPTAYTATSHKLNAPTLAYDFVTANQARLYGNGTAAANLVLLTPANYQAPMPDDTAFNGAAATNAGRSTLLQSTDPAVYDAVFGDSAGGNWFDISATGLTSIQYVRLNGVNVGTGTTDAYNGVRLDGAFANAAAVPEPAGVALLALGALALAGRRRWGRRGAGVAASAAAAFLPVASGDAVAQVGFDDITQWTGSGSKRAALVIHWSAPEVFNNTTVPAPVSDRVLVWGYRFDGADKTGADLFSAVVAADPRLYATVGFGGGFVFGLGYDLDNDGDYGVTNGTTTFGPSSFVNGKLNNSDYDPDRFGPADTGDLYWAGLKGPGWDMWTETGEAGGFAREPIRGSDPYWTPSATDPFAGSHGEWDLAVEGLAGQALVDGSWQGWSVAAGGLEFSDPNAPGTVAYNTHKQAPAAVPEPSGVALVVCAGWLSLARSRRRRA